MPTFEQVQDELRRWWEKTRRRAGERWEDVRHSFQFGWEAGAKGGVPRQKWEDVREDLRRTWEQTSRRAGETWEDVKDYVREAWERARKAVRAGAGEK